MKIYRDGKEYELTFSEMIQANEEYKLDCMIEDVKEQYENGEYDVELTDEQIEEVASLALHNLGKNDSYFESYWMSVEYTLGDYINSLPTAEEEEEE
jgi:hypothetical protein